MTQQIPQDLDLQDLDLQDLDLDACAREPIHIPGSIQPHGMLLAIRLSDRTIAYASANIADTFGLDPDAILRQPLAQILPALSAEFEADLADPPQAGSTRTLRTVRVGTSEGVLPYEAAISRSGECAIIELEAPPSGTLSSIDMLYPTLRRFVDQLQGASTIDDLCRLAAQDIRRMTGFDRVLIYRFDEQWNGTVHRRGPQRGPAVLSRPALSRLRHPGPGARALPPQPAAHHPRCQLHAGARSSRETPRDPLDLSHSVLRSVSPVHLEYMRNMGTLASMSISILRDGELWGLISCHNKEPKRVSLQVRNACDFLTQIFSLAARGAGEHGARREPGAARHRPDPGFSPIWRRRITSSTAS